MKYLKFLLGVFLSLALAGCGGGVGLPYQRIGIGDQRQLP